MKYKTIIEVDAGIIRQMNELLALDSGVEDTKDGDTIQTFYADFDNGYQADIKVCNGSANNPWAGAGSPPWIDAVLFDKNGNELTCFVHEGDSLEGDYHFAFEDNEFIVIVSPKTPVPKK